MLLSYALLCSLYISNLSPSLVRFDYSLNKYLFHLHILLFYCHNDTSQHTHMYMYICVSFCVLFIINTLIFSIQA